MSGSTSDSSTRSAAVVVEKIAFGGFATQSTPSLAQSSAIKPRRLRVVVVLRPRALRQARAVRLDIGVKRLDLPRKELVDDPVLVDGVGHGTAELDVLVIRARVPREAAVTELEVQVLPHGTTQYLNGGAFSLECDQLFELTYVRRRVDHIQLARLPGVDQSGRVRNEAEDDLIQVGQLAARWRGRSSSSCRCEPDE